MAENTCHDGQCHSKNKITQQKGLKLLCSLQSTKNRFPHFSMLQNAVTVNKSEKINKVSLRWLKKRQNSSWPEAELSSRKSFGNTEKAYYMEKES